VTVTWVRPDLCVLRGGGDLATGVVWRITRAGWPVIVCELPAPLTVRRRAAVSTAVTAGEVVVEGLRAVRVEDPHEAVGIAESGVVAVVVSPKLPPLQADVVVDARVAKRNLDTTIHDAPLVVGLGPGFTAGVDCHAVVETQRGPHLGRVLWTGTAAPNTGTPGIVEGRGVERVLRSPISGRVRWNVAIGDSVDAHAVLGEVRPDGMGADEAASDEAASGEVAGATVYAPIAGVVRGLIGETVNLTPGLKIGDVDPRPDSAGYDEISDKALAVGGGVVDAIHTWLRRSVQQRG
jgi:xanthine dehydrogenase accessory factor